MQVSLSPMKGDIAIHKDHIARLKLHNLLCHSPQDAQCTQTCQMALMQLLNTKKMSPITQSPSEGTAIENLSNEVKFSPNRLCGNTSHKLWLFWPVPGHYPASYLSFSLIKTSCANSISKAQVYLHVIKLIPFPWSLIYSHLLDENTSLKSDTKVCLVGMWHLGKFLRSRKSGINHVVPFTLTLHFLS